jgi:hypothetical protein
VVIALSLKDTVVLPPATLQTGIRVGQIQRYKRDTLLPKGEKEMIVDGTAPTRHHHINSHNRIEYSFLVILFEKCLK